MYQLLSVWGAEDLHTIIACAEEESTEDVYHKVDPDVQSSCFGAAAFEKGSDGTFGFFVWTRPDVYGDGEVEDTDNRGTDERHNRSNAPA